MPVSTYRLQIHGGFTFADAARVVPYLRDLGISHLYLSPILEPSPGSTHGYDVVDHDALNSEAGGRHAFDALVAAAHDAGLGLIVDVVPNHMTVPAETYLNAPLWDVLRFGQKSQFADWFDVDWEAGENTVLMPVLGADLPTVLEQGELVLAHDGGPDGDETVLRYYAHEFPVDPATAHLPLSELVGKQAYRLAYWEVGATDLNYRRFFDVTALKAVRVEDDSVFDATHELLLALHAEGAIDGFRIDHPDGLADPEGYLARLARRTGGAWVVVEKILEGHEDLVAEWQCAGTTGYDALLRISQVLTDPTGTDELTRLWTEVADPARHDLEQVIRDAKSHVVSEVLAPEVGRLLRLVERVLPHADADATRRALDALLVSMDRYRAYLVPGRRPARSQLVVLAQAAGRARELLDPEDHASLDQVVQLARGGRPAGAESGEDAGSAAEEFIVRFQQTCGPVMAKGIEDTAFYRWLRLSGANEVGGDPGTLSIEADEFHAYAEERLAQWPLTMTTLSTHDTKRSEDVRARLAALAERPEDWEQWLSEARRLAAGMRGELVDPESEYLVWQTVIGTWPLIPERLEPYLLKAVREAKLHTSWVGGDPAYEAAVVAFGQGVVTEPQIGAHIDSWVSVTAESARAFSLGQKLIQLTMPGVPDVYQGGELPLLTLVDPDNRQPVDYAANAALLARLDAGEAASDLAGEKLALTAAALRLRREHADWFVGEDAAYLPLESSSAHAIAFGRGAGEEIGAVTIATIAPHRLAQAGGWDSETLDLPPGRWRDLLSGTEIDADAEGTPLASLLAQAPVALLVRA